MPQEPKVPATVVIKYNGQDITQYCSIADTTFTGRASGSPGQATVTFKDTRQRFHFIPGRTLELFINDERAWDGYAMSLGYNYWFETHTANCEPCPHVTPRKLVLYGADRNILLQRRVLYNKADPTGTPYPDPTIWPANTPDNEVIVATIDNFVDDIDGVDYTTKVEHVGSPDPYVEFKVPEVGSTLLTMLSEVAQSTGAVFYIDPDRYLVYTDVNSPDAPFVLSDYEDVDVDGEIGYRDASLLSDGSRLINDAMIWGAGQGTPNIVFRRVEDEESIAAHGRWQNTGGFRFNLWQGDSVQRVADSIIYGSPANKRGHKDPVVSFRCTIFHHGFRVAQKAEVNLNTFNFLDVIPIREMTITFISPTRPMYELKLSHDIDEPWTTSEFWWPPKQTGPPDPPPPGTVCTTPVPVDTGIATGSNNADPDVLVLLPSEREVQQNDIRDFVSIEPDGFPPNKWTYVQSYDGIIYGQADMLSTAPAVGYKHQWADRYWYNAGDGDLQNPGELILVWQNAYKRVIPPANFTFPDGGCFLHIDGHINFTGTETQRDITGHLFPLPGVSRDGSTPITRPNLVQIHLLEPRTGWLDDDGSFHAETAPPPHTLGSVIWEGFLDPASNIPVHLTTWLPKGSQKWLAIDIQEPLLIKPWGSVEVESNFVLSWTEARRQTVGIGPDEDGVECVEVGYGSTNVHLPATLLYGTTYRVPLPYVPGTTRVYVDGIHWTDYTESSPTLGQITLGSAVDGEVTVAYISAVSNLSLPDAPGYFIRPTSGPITGTFGAQTSGWPPVYWHGVYYEHFHNGVDFGVPEGTPVYAAAAGFVRLETQFAGGTMVHIFHENGLRSTYAHLSQRLVDDSEIVAQGQIIAYSGATGDVTGPHLHWGCVFQGSPENPLGFV